MPAAKIAFIGVGSASFGPTTLATIIREPKLRGSELALIDLNEAALSSVTRVAERMNEAWDAGMTIRASTERRDLLQDMEFVIVAIEMPPREELWRMDWEIPALVNGMGIQGAHIGAMPQPIAELLRREAALVEMVVDTAVSGDRDLALQPLLLDPMINDIDRARNMLDDYLIQFAPYLPQF